MMTRIFTIAGWSNSGKTTLIVKLIKEIKKRGLKVMTLKNASEKYYLEPEGKDSLNFLKAGADSVYLSSKKELMKMKLIIDNNDLFNNLESEFNKYDIVLLEGLTRKNIPIIEVYDQKINNNMKFPENDLYAVISDNFISKNIPIFGKNDIIEIVEKLIQYNIPI